MRVSRPRERFNVSRLDEPTTGLAEGVEALGEVIKLHAPECRTFSRRGKLKALYGANGTYGGAGVMSSRHGSDEAHAIAGYEGHAMIFHQSEPRSSPQSYARGPTHMLLALIPHDANAASTSRSTSSGQRCSPMEPSRYSEATTNADVSTCAVCLYKPSGLKTPARALFRAGRLAAAAPYAQSRGVGVPRAALALATVSWLFGVGRLRQCFQDRRMLTEMREPRIPFRWRVELVGVRLELRRCVHLGRREGCAPAIAKRTLELCDDTRS